jgi:hypothetical protein
MRKISVFVSFWFVAAMLMLPPPTSAAPVPFKPGEYLWFMGGDLYLQRGVGELRILEGPNLVIPNLKQRPPGWTGTYREIFFSLDGLKQAIAKGLSPSSVQVLIYDPEQYLDKRTPYTELADPINAVKAFAAIAHSHGFIVAYAPSCGLVQTGAMGIWAGRDPKQPAYWRVCADAVWANAAPYVDLIDLQVQGIQQNVAEYQAVVNYAARVIRAANARIKIIAQVSTQVSGASTTSLYEAANAVHALVDGYFLSYRWTNPAEQSLIASFLMRAVSTFHQLH